MKPCIAGLSFLVLLGAATGAPAQDAIATTSYVFENAAFQQAQMALTIDARPQAPSTIYYVYYYNRANPRRVFLYMTTRNYSQALRAVHYLNEDPRVFAYYRAR